MSRPIETEEYRGFTIEIYADEDAENPREWGQSSVFYGKKHNRYFSVDADMEELPEYQETGDVRETIARLNKCGVALPVYACVHSGVALNAMKPNEAPTYPFTDPWDSGLAGLIFIDRQGIARDYGWKKITKERREQIENRLSGEMETYSAYLNGDTYGYIVKDEDGEHIDSCWGFYGWEDAEGYMMDQAREAADGAAQQRDQTINDAYKAMDTFACADLLATV